MTWDKAYMAGWIALATIVFSYEMYALIWGHNRYPMLTQVTVKYIPWWATMIFLTWLWIHFALRYSNSQYIKDLATNHPYSKWI